jgi:Ca2+-binding EF-hand superfamily protein
MYERIVQQYKNLWIEVDENMNKRLDFDEIKQLIEKLNIDVDDSYLKALIVKHDASKTSDLDFPEFMSLMDDIKKRSELVEIFDSIKNPTTGMVHLQELTKFRKEVQRVA